MITSILEWLNQNSKSMGSILTLVSVISIPLGLFSYIKNSRKESRDREYGTFDALDNKYFAYQELCLKYPELDISDIQNVRGNIRNADPIKTKQELTAFSSLIAIFERAYVMYRTRGFKGGNSQWEGWVDSMRQYTDRNNFRNAWKINGFGWDKGFEDFFNQLIEESYESNTVNCKYIGLTEKNQFYDIYNSSITLEDDKDSYEDFVKIIDSGEEGFDFYISTISREQKIQSGCLFFIMENQQDYQPFYDSVGLIIYISTKKEARRQKHASNLLEKIRDLFPKTLFFAEVVDDNKLTKQQQQAEKTGSEIEFSHRNNFWAKNGFSVLDFDYHNPLPDLSKNCNGFVDYNNLMVQTDMPINSEALLKSIGAFFKYCYLAGSTDGHEWEAYNKIESQIKDKGHIGRVD